MASTPFRASKALPLVFALLVAVGAGTALAGEPATALGKWMKPNMGTPLAGQDFATLQKSLVFIAGKPPSGDYPKWAEYSNAGARAAGKQDLKELKASCKVCHEAYKERYKKEFAAAPFP
jgi:hypothetical protein